ncbi:hypothetical protein [Peptoniphilus genitalis]|uniref:hypothetical protein n=1 Tax=Peptoniphilus genitalis TaxID=3036303 RepID=UPI0024AD1F36|nr:hypothetical protein [Peptoniphilus sp. Marseille-Q7072]
MKKQISKYLFFVGFAFSIVICFLPQDLFEKFINLMPTGIATLFICPLIGLVGLMFGIREKNKLFSILNILLMLLLPIAMYAGPHLRL